MSHVALQRVSGWRISRQPPNGWPTCWYMGRNLQGHWWGERPLAVIYDSREEVEAIARVLSQTFKGALEIEPFGDPQR